MKFIYLLIVSFTISLSLYSQTPTISSFSINTTSSTRCFPKLEWYMVYSNLSQVEIQRSTNSQNFFSIDVINVTPTNSTSSPVGFSYIDENPFSSGGNNSTVFSYRLKIIAMNGSIYYSSNESITNINPFNSCSYNNGRCNTAVISGSSTAFLCNPGETLTITNQPFQSTPITWSSSNTSVATIDNTGKVNPISPGTTIFSAYLPVCNFTIYKSISFCNCDVPTGLGVVNSGSAYQLYFNQLQGVNSYRLEWINLSNNSTGSRDITYTGSNYSFTDVQVGSSFRFRVASISSCGVGTFSGWFEYGAVPTCSNTSPTNLVASCTCGPSCATSCGYERFSWTAVAGVTNYEVNYEIVNINTGTVGQQNTFTAYSVPYVIQIPNYWNYTGTGWVIRFRVRTICGGGVFGPFSPWSSNFSF